ncbi:MAG: type II toxin-antitoxin system VapC family toxin [Mucilaginibacter sp.]|uniref:type II toxin-antitoxin system VapC family toxin n=1 Tax=Mucilaginibacter sp. TaxID=1882438 RepID=UPI0034E38FE6
METAKVICDTDVMIDYLNNNSERHFNTKNLIENFIGTENVVLSAVTKMELIIGATNKKDMERINKSILRYTIAFINNEISQVGIRLLQDYKLSHGLAMPDALIAATSLVTQIPLFTYNVKDYKFIDGMELFDPGKG